MDALLKHQRGLSFLSFFFFCILSTGIIFLAFKTVPIVIEYLAIKNGLEKALRAANENEIKKAFTAAIAGDYVGEFTANDLIFQQANNRLTVGFVYERKIPLGGPVSLTFNFADNRFAVQ